MCKKKLNSPVLCVCVCVFRCVTLSWCSRGGGSRQVAVSEVLGVAPAVSLRAASSPAVAPGGQATPSPTKKALESWSRQEKTWDSPPWPWPALPPGTARAGSKPSVGRKILTLLPAPLGTAVRRPAMLPGWFHHFQALRLSWAAHRKRRSRRRRSQKQVRTLKLSPLRSHSQQLQDQLRPVLLRTSPLLLWGQTHQEAGHCHLELCRSAHSLN